MFSDIWEGTVLTSMVLSAVTGACRSLLVRNSAVHIFDKNQYRMRTRFVNAFKFILSFQEYSVKYLFSGLYQQEAQKKLS